MEKAKLKKGLAVLGVLALVVAGGLGSLVGISKAASNDIFMDKVAKYAGEAIADKLEALGALSASAINDFLGSVQTVALHATGETVTNLGGLFLWDTDSNSGLEVKGPTWLQAVNVSTTLTVAGTSTFAYTNNQLNTPQVAFNSASTTLCSVQNTSGVDRVIPSFTLGLTGSTGSGGLSQFRAYVSAGRADTNSAATSTLMKQAFIAVATTMKSVFGGPVPGSYYVTSSAAYDTAIGTQTTTPVIWPAGWYANATSTAITSSTGNCMIASYPL